MIKEIVLRGRMLRMLVEKIAGTLLDEAYFSKISIHTIDLVSASSSTLKRSHRKLINYCLESEMH